MQHSLFDLTGKTAFITGATKGIGRAIAEAFADHGATFVLTSRNGSEAQAVAAEINARVGRDAATGMESDLYDLKKSLAAYDAAVAQFGRIDILVCNAAATPSLFGGAADFPVEEYASRLQANVVNNLAMMNHAAAAMKARRDGVILATSSAAGVRTTYGVFPYGVSKGALSHAVRLLASELAPYNVRVNAVAPGLTRSWSVEQAIAHAPEMMDAFTKSIPLGRITEAEEIAAGMVFLASAGGKAITGQTIVMDGGETGSGAPTDV
ncbi:SDR family oxidoreductase [soil metagenome]